MIAERKTVEPAEDPTREQVEACLKASLKYRERMLNGIKGRVEPSLREQMAQALLRAWDEIAELQSKQSRLLALIDSFEVNP